jgi:hypothetical protein
VVVRVALVLLVGCRPQLDEAVVSSGRHVTVHAAAASSTNRSATATASSHTGIAAAMLGIEPRPIEYLFDGGVGCASGTYALIGVRSRT